MPDLRVPEKALEALAFQLALEQYPDYRVVGGWEKFQYERPADTKLYLGKAERTLHAALPAIYEQRDREWRERLIGEYPTDRVLKENRPIDAAKKVLHDSVFQRGDSFEEMARRTIDAAIAAAFPEK